MPVENRTALQRPGEPPTVLAHQRRAPAAWTRRGQRPAARRSPQGLGVDDTMNFYLPGTLRFSVDGAFVYVTVGNTTRCADVESGGLWWIFDGGNGAPRYEGPRLARRVSQTVIRHWHLLSFNMVPLHKSTPTASVIRRNDCTARPLQGAPLVTVLSADEGMLYVLCAGADAPAGPLSHGWQSHITLLVCMENRE